jgi:hypothetical protein
MLALLLTVGCGTSCGTAPDPAPTPVLLESADLRLPLFDYMHSPTQGLVVTNAYRALLGRCMERYGLARPAATAARPLVGPRTWTERRYGLTEPADAEAHGYGLGKREPTRKASDTPDLGPVALAVITGNGAKQVGGRAVPSGGCQEESRRRLAMTPTDADPALPQRLSQLSFQRSREDPRVRAAVHAWSTCMRSAGLDYATPFDPMADPAFRTGTPHAEIATARADLACKRRSNLVGVWFTVESGYQRRLIAKNAPALEKSRTANQTMLRLAHQVLGP